MSTSKLKVNPNKTKFIIFGSKRQGDKLKACFPIDILGNLLCPVDSVKNLGVWFDSDLLNSMISGSFLLMMFLYLWLMLLLLVVWITAAHFSGASPS